MTIELTDIKADWIQVPTDIAKIQNVGKVTILYHYSDTQPATDAAAHRLTLLDTLSIERTIWVRIEKHHLEINHVGTLVYTDMTPPPVV